MQTLSRIWIPTALLIGLAGPAAAAETGAALREVWFGISGTSIDSLTGAAAYPANPGDSALVTAFEAPTNIADNYGQRLRAILYPAVSGDYVFTIASDDSSRLLLSTSEDPAGAAEIASVNGWTSSRQWGKYASQRSVAVALVAGQGYYIEALQKEGGGGDNLAVAWEGPGISRSVIPGAVLAPVGGAGGNLPPLASIVVDQAAGVAPFTVQFDASGSKDFDGTIAGYAWDFGDGASGSGSAVSHSFTTAGSFVVTLSVTDDLGASAGTTLQIEVDSDAIPAGTGSGYLLHEIWTGLNSGTAVTDLTTAVSYPHAPTDRRLLAQAEVPTNLGSNFGQRISGLLHPPVSGDYVFWIASDDNGSLRLANDADPANLTEIATVSAWTSSRQWDKYASQKSAVISLQAGTAYAFEAVAKEAGGGDNLAIAWQGPGWQREIIAGEFLSPPAALPPGSGDGGITRAVYPGISGTSISNLESHASYPDSPSLVETVARFQAPTNVGDSYGQRVRGFLHPPVSATYVFHISSDDHSVLRLSTDGDHANLQPIASVSGWTSSLQWDKYSSQRSVAIDLLHGQVYAIEAVMKEGGGGDNLAVAWTVPGWSRSVIDGAYLSGIQALDGQRPVATPPTVEDVLVNTPVTIVLAGTDGDGDPLTFEISDSSHPGIGSLDVSNLPEVVLTPAQGYVGTLTFEYLVFDGTSYSEPGMVSVTFLPASNLPPTVEFTFAPTTPNSGMSVTFDASASSDADGSIVSYVWSFGDGKSGSGVISSNMYLNSGDFVVELTVTDDQGLSASLSTVLVVTGSNAAEDPPIVGADRYVIPEEGGDLTVNVLDGVLANDSSPDGSGMSVVVAQGPINGVLSLNPDGSFFYDASQGFSGIDSFTYTATNGVVTSGEVQVTLLVASEASAVATNVVPASDFDPSEYASDSGPYLAAVVPGRIWDVAEPGPGVPRIHVSGSTYRSLVGPGAVEIRVVVEPGAPVSFHAPSKGVFAGNGRNTLSVQADESGHAVVTFEAPSNGRFVVLAGSPLASGQARIVVRVR